MRLIAELNKPSRSALDLGSAPPGPAQTGVTTEPVLDHILDRVTGPYIFAWDGTSEWWKVELDDHTKQG